MRRTMNSLTCKGYSARIVFDQSDGIYVGRILGLRSIISFHSETEAQLRVEFEKAVDDFLADCAEEGTKPE